MPVSQRRWAIESAVALPFLWSFVAFLLAMCIAPPPLSHQLLPVYHHSPRTDVPSHLDNATPGEGRTALILTAHPDDEAMFFAPTIRGLRNHGWDVRGLCLSTGNSEGQGQTRAEELRRSYDVLGVEKGKVQVLDVPYLQDDLSAMWNSEEVQRVVSDYLEKRPVDIVITFDPSGVSQHPNHAALSSYRPPGATKLYHLLTPSIFTKYTGPLNPVLRRGWYQLAKGMAEWMNVFDMTLAVPVDLTITNAGLDWVRSVRAMLQHKSQLTWYRYGWLAAGSLMWVNDLKQVI